MPLHNLRLGISGQADAVEFRATGCGEPGGVELEGKRGRWVPSPVEYKRGKPKKQICDLVQVCAQALCLEEIFDVAVPTGALFYATPRRRQEVRLRLSFAPRRNGSARGCTIFTTAGKRLRRSTRKVARVAP
ncbi:MAG: Dna2/Cas4 domain-containing protein [Ignavibacteriota bacterium]